MKDYTPRNSYLSGAPEAGQVHVIWVGNNLASQLGHIYPVSSRSDGPPVTGSSRRPRWPHLDRIGLTNDTSMDGASLQDLKIESRDFRDCYTTVTQNSRFFVSSGGSFGLTHVGTQEGDLHM